MDLMYSYHNFTNQQCMWVDWNSVSHHIIHHRYVIMIDTFETASYGLDCTCTWHAAAFELCNKLYNLSHNKLEWCSSYICLIVLGDGQFVTGSCSHGRSTLGRLCTDGQMTAVSEEWINQLILTLPSRLIWIFHYYMMAAVSQLVITIQQLNRPFEEWLSSTELLHSKTISIRMCKCTDRTEHCRPQLCARAIIGRDELHSSSYKRIVHHFYVASTAKFAMTNAVLAVHTYIYAVSHHTHPHTHTVMNYYVRLRWWHSPRSTTENGFGEENYLLAGGRKRSLAIIIVLCIFCRWEATIQDRCIIA